MVHRIQFRSHQQEFLHLKQALRFDGFKLSGTVLELEGAGQATRSCVIAGRVDEAVDVSLIICVDFLMILSFLIRGNFTVEVSDHSLNWSARTERKSVGVKWVND